MHQLTFGINSVLQEVNTRFYPFLTALLVALLILTQELLEISLKLCLHCLKQISYAFKAKKFYVGQHDSNKLKPIERLHFYIWKVCFVVKLYEDRLC